jgi:hypothetical protein
LPVAVHEQQGGNAHECQRLAKAHNASKLHVFSPAAGRTAHAG